MATAGNVRNGSAASSPMLMEDLDGVYQYGLLIRADFGVTLFRRTIDADPLDPANYSTYDLSADATATAALDLPINSIDDHWNLGIGVDEQDRLHIAGNTHATAQNYIRSNGAWPPTFTQPTYSGLPWALAGSARFTYNIFARLSDGRLLWFFDQGDSTISDRGRDWLAYYLPTGAGTTWLPLIGTAEFASTNADNPQGITADRVYVTAVVVEARPAGDRIHVAGIWRTEDEDADSTQQPFYVYTDTVGSASDWHNVDGTAIAVPVTWANRADYLIDSAPGFSRGGGTMGIDADGLPHTIWRNGNSLGEGVLSDESGTLGSYVRCYHDGTDWQVARISGVGSSNPPSIHRIRRDMWMVTSVFDRMRIRNDAALPTSSTFLMGGPVDSVLGSETMDLLPDPVALAVRHRLDLLIPDGDDPYVYSFGNQHRAIAS